MIYFCCEENRRRLTREHRVLYGIDYLEVIDVDAPSAALRQRTLRVFFTVKSATPEAPAQALRKEMFDRLAVLDPELVRLTGGERVTGISVESVELHAADDTRLAPGARPELVAGDHLAVVVNQRGDYSTYTLALVEPNSDEPLEGLDPALAAVDFSFKVECPSPFDCRTERACPPERAAAPDIDYLAKDYASFRQLILDRLSLIVPAWRERNVADHGIALVELLAYVGDYLSYRQDAIGTEAYLGTARQRESVRRHARLLDYAMHDGCNARAWVHVRLKRNAPAAVRLPRFLVQAGGNWEEPKDGEEPVPGNGTAVRRVRFATRLSGRDTTTTVVADEEFDRLVGERAADVFEPMESVTLFRTHNEMRFHTWGDADCCLPKGAVKATLRGRYPNLAAGMVLIFQEMLGARTGEVADADPQRRHPVRLTAVELSTDPIMEQPITTIQWAVEDALPIAFTLSGVKEDGSRLADVSVALGNIVLADHGMTVHESPLNSGRPNAGASGPVPEPDPFLMPVDAPTGDRCARLEPKPSPPRFRVRLSSGGLTQTATTTVTRLLSGRRVPLAFDPMAPAASVFPGDRQQVLPAIRLGDKREILWLPKGDLLSSDSFAPEFVAEIGNDGVATLRFGDDDNGQRPASGESFHVQYRIGNGPGGNVGAGAIVHVTSDALLESAAWIKEVSNPLPARGGRAPETIEEVKQYAPAAFRVPQRAVTPDDYARRAEKHADVQRAVATLRWTGAWHTIFLTVDRLGGRVVDQEFEKGLREFIEPFRMAGHDLEVDGPRFVALEIEMLVCVEAGYFRSDVLENLRDVFGRHTRADGTTGFFHPDHFTFGQPVHGSALYAAAQNLAGVRHVELTTFQRLEQPHTDAREAGQLTVGRLEIARLDNDPNFPERGVLRFTMKGGR